MINAFVTTKFIVPFDKVILVTAYYQGWNIYYSESGHITINNIQQINDFKNWLTKEKKDV
jgi:hypothetical protein